MLSVELVLDDGLMLLWPLFFALYARRREPFPLRLTLSLLTCALLLGGMLLGNLAVPETMILAWLRLTSLLLILLSWATVMVCWDLSIRKGLFCAVCGYALQNLVSNLRTVVSMALQWERLPLLFLLTPLLGAVGYFLWVRRLRNGLGEPTMKSILFGLATVVAACIILPSELYRLDMGDYRTDISRIVNGVCILLCCAITEALVSAVENRKIREDNQRLAWLIEQRQAQYESARAAMEQINVKYHDLKHYLQSNPPGGVLDEAMRQSIEEIVRPFEVQYDTGCKALDVVLWEKGKLCQERGIQFDCAAQGEALGFMRPIDVYTLFENILQNAVEAAARCAPEQRLISMTVGQKESFLAIHVENSCVKLPEFRDGVPLTDKADKGEHGFGVTSMKLIAARYHGAMAVKGAGQLFTVNIMLPLERRAA